MSLLPSLIAITVLSLYFLQKRFSRGLHKFRGPYLASFTDSWKVWNAFRVSRSRNDLYVDLHEQYGDVVRIGPNNISFADPRAIIEIYGTKGSQQKSAMYDVFAVPVKGVRGHTLLASRDQHWHDQQRRLINSAFSTTSILRYEPWVDDTIDILIRELKTRFISNRGESLVLNLYAWLGYFAADVISNLTYGQRTGFLETGRDVENIQKGVGTVFRFWFIFAQMPVLDSLTFKNPLLLWLNRHGLLEPKKPLSAVVRRQFMERQKVWEQTKANASDRETLVDRFLKVQSENAEKIELPPERHALTMVVAGSETTSITLSSVFYFLLKHPSCYQQLQNEVDAVSRDQLRTERITSNFSWQVVQNMPYLDACIREAMRLHPVQRIPHDRVVPKGGMTICGHWIPAGTDVGIFPTVLHRRKEIFGEDVESYRPERWLEDQSKTEQMKSSMFTFSYGKYTCLGQNISKLEIYKLIPTIMKTFNIRLLDPDWIWELRQGAFAMPVELPVYLEARGDKGSS